MSGQALPRCRTRRARQAALAVAATLSVAAAGCSGDDESAPPSTEQLSTTTTQPRLSDGVLRIGVLLPLTGVGATLGTPLVEMVEKAVGQVNAAGGVLGSDVQYVVRDEGPDLAAADTAATALVEDDGVDAVIGPASSRVALNVVPGLVSAGVLTCSPTATAASLTDLPDQGLFVRTVASDNLQALAMAEAVTGTGKPLVLLVYPDDAYGRRFARALRADLARPGNGLTLVAELAYDPADEDFTAEVEALMAEPVVVEALEQGSLAPVVALVGDVDSGSRVLSALLSTPVQTEVVVNDQLVNVDLASLVEAHGNLDGRFMRIAVNAYDGSARIGERFGIPETDVPPFAAAATDCVDLIALGAVQAGSDDPAEIAAQLASISRGGTECDDFAECLFQIGKDSNFNFNGSTGLVELDASGDQRAAWFVRIAISDGEPRRNSFLITAS